MGCLAMFLVTSMASPAVIGPYRWKRCDQTGSSTPSSLNNGTM